MAAAINKHIFLESNPSNRDVSIIEMPDIGDSMELNLKVHKEKVYESKREYLKSGYNVLLREGYKWRTIRPQSIKITGNIPINAGASSSSALVIGWLAMLTELAGEKLIAERIASQGYQAEVLEFNEGGGMMDHYASALGGLIYMQTWPEFIPEKIDINDEVFKRSFILINSEQKKETVDDLIRTKERALKSFKVIQGLFPDFNKYSTTINDIEQFKGQIEKDLYDILQGNLENRDLTKAARDFLIKNQGKTLDSNQKKAFGELLYKHHHNLSKKIGVSTPKIDEILELCIDAGAYGGKINGSGFGGTLFVYCPDHYEDVLDELNKKAIEHYPIEISSGVRVKNEE